MRRLSLLAWSSLIIATLSSATAGRALACDPNANCHIQECAGPNKCIEVIDKVCEAHKAACLAFPPPSRNPAPSAGSNPSPAPMKQKKITQRRPATDTPRHASIFEDFDSKKKQQFVNLVANEWLVKTAGTSAVPPVGKVLQETLIAAAAEMPDLTDRERKDIVHEVLENRKEFSELHAATNAVLATLTEHNERPPSSNAGSSEAENSIRPFPFPPQKCD
jgi:hypothetical protein